MLVREGFPVVTFISKEISVRALTRTDIVIAAAKATARAEFLLTLRTRVFNKITSFTNTPSQSSLHVVNYFVPSRSIEHSTCEFGKDAIIKLRTSHHFVTKGLSLPMSTRGSWTTFIFKRNLGQGRTSKVFLSEFHDRRSSNVLLSVNCFDRILFIQEHIKIIRRENKRMDGLVHDDKNPLSESHWVLWGHILFEQVQVNVHVSNSWSTTGQTELITLRTITGIGQHIAAISKGLNVEKKISVGNTDSKMFSGNLDLTNTTFLILVIRINYNRSSESLDLDQICKVIHDGRNNLSLEECLDASGLLGDVAVIHINSDVLKLLFNW